MHNPHKRITKRNYIFTPTQHAQINKGKQYMHAHRIACTSHNTSEQYMNAHRMQANSSINAAELVGHLPSILSRFATGR